MDLYVTAIYSYFLNGNEILNMDRYSPTTHEELSMEIVFRSW